MHQRILLAKEYMNQRLIITVDQQNWVKMMAKHCLMTNVNIIFFLPRTCFLQKKPQRWLHMETQQGGSDV